MITGYFLIFGGFIVGYITCALLGAFADEQTRADRDRHFEAILQRVRAGKTIPADEMDLRELMLYTLETEADKKEDRDRRRWRFAIYGALTILVGALLLGCMPAGSSEVPTADVQKAIIAKERPEMGPREREFWRSAIEESAKKHGISPALLTAKIAQESQFNQHLVSSTGARCAAQIMPAHYKSPGEIREIEACLDRGAEILAAYIKECGSIERGLRCYYAGPGLSAKGNSRTYAWYSDAILARVYLAEQGLKVKGNA